MVVDIFIKNIDFAVDERELSDAISAALSVHQPDDNPSACRCSIVKIPRDYETGDSRGFAFVTVDAGVLQVEDAVRILFGLPVRERGLHVEKLRPRKPL